MIELRPMINEEYDKIMKNDLEEYIKDISVYKDQFTKEMGLDPRKYAEKQFKELLPKGIESENNYFFIVSDQETKIDVGYMWIMNDLEKGIVFLAQIRVYDEFQGKSYGTQLLKELDKIAKEKHNAKAITLHVFQHNPKAKRLYEKLGYQVKNETPAGHQMFKPL